MKTTKDLMLILFIIITISTIYTIQDGYPNKGHDFLGTYSIIKDNSRFFPDWYMGTYMYLEHPFFPFLFSLLIESYLHASKFICLKFFFTFFYLLSFLTFYLFILKITRDRLASLVASLGYLLNPYHLVESIIEGHGMLNIALALSPLCFYFVERILENPNSKINVVSFGLSLGVMMYTHPQVIILFYPFIFLYVLLRLSIIFMKNKKMNYKLLLHTLFIPLFIATLLGVDYWLPILIYKNLFYSITYSIEDSIVFTVDLLHIVTLHPPSCCLPDITKYFNDCIIMICSFIYPIFVSITLLLIRNNNKKLDILIPSLVIYFLSLFIAAGLKSPIPLYKFLFENVLFFNSIRTPPRFLFINSLFLFTIIGIGMSQLFKSLKDNKPKIVVVIVVTLIFIYISHNEAKEGFQTFKIPKELNELYSFLSNEKYGRIFPIPFDTWVYTPEWRNVVNPLLWTFIYNKEVVGGGAPNFAVRYVGDYLNFIWWTHKFNNIDIQNFNYLYNVRYIVVDKEYNLHKNVIFKSDKVKKIFENDRYIVYLNENTTGDIFLLISKENKISVESINKVQGTTNLVLNNLSKNSFEVIYNFNNPYKDWLCFSISLQQSPFLSYNDEIYFKYKIYNVSPDNIRYSIALVEDDGSKYYIEWQSFDGKEGYVRIPIALLQLKYSNDENHKLDLNSIKELWIIIEEKNYYKNKKFSIFFSNFSVFNNKIIKIDYMKKSKLEYVVNFSRKDIDLIRNAWRNNLSTYLVLNYGYFPNWIGKWNNTILHHIRILHFLNGYELSKNVRYKYKQVYITYKPYIYTYLLRYLKTSVLLVIFNNKVIESDRHEII